MNADAMDRKFQDGLDLMNADKVQEGAEIWMELAEQGHLISIRELFHIFLDQQDFEAAESYISCAKDPNDPTILYLQARLIEERDGIDAAEESFNVAAQAGHPGAMSLIFLWAIENRDIATATYYLERLKEREDELSVMNEPTKINELLNQLEGLRSNLLEILPVFFALASGNWMRTRDEINSRHDDEEVWENYLDENGLTVEQFNRYEQWWISPSGRVVVEKLASQFSAAFLEEANPEMYDAFEDFLNNFANWDDFIRELSDCTPADAVSTGSGPSYFAEYALENGLCDSVAGSSGDDQLIAEIIEITESWFKDNHEEAQSILLSSYDDIMKIR